MKWMDYELPLGISITQHAPDAVDDFVEKGFRYFEVGIPARLEGQEPSQTPWRGRERTLVETKLPLVRRIFDHHLRVWSVHLPFGFGWDIAHYDEAERDAVCVSLKRVMDCTKDWGPRVYVLHGCLEPVLPEERAVRIARSIRSLRELDEYAARFGARVALEDLPRSCLANSSVEARAMAQAAGNVPICFDVNHLLGETHGEFLWNLASNVVTTHLSDYDGVDERHWLPGEGIVPWKEVAWKLMDAGYRGPFLFELRAGKNGPYAAGEVLAAFERAMTE